MKVNKLGASSSLEKRKMSVLNVNITLGLGQGQTAILPTCIDLADFCTVVQLQLHSLHLDKAKQPVSHPAATNFCTLVLPLQKIQKYLLFFGDNFIQWKWTNLEHHNLLKSVKCLFEMWTLHLDTGQTAQFPTCSDLYMCIKYKMHIYWKYVHWTWTWTWTRPNSHFPNMHRPCRFLHSGATPGEIFWFTIWEVDSELWLAFGQNQRANSEAARLAGPKDYKKICMYKRKYRLEIYAYCTWTRPNSPILKLQRPFKFKTKEQIPNLHVQTGLQMIET